MIPALLLATLLAVIPLAGQSNVRGLGSLAQAPHVPVGHAYYCKADTGNANVQITPYVRDPMQQYYAQAISNTGSMWPAFADAWWQETSTPLVFCGGAVNGQGMAAGAYNWSYNSRNLDALVAKTNAALDSIAQQGDTGYVPFLILEGGEQDAQAGVTRAQEAAAITAFASNARAQFDNPNLPIYIISIDSAPGYEAGYANVRAGQADAAASIPGVHVVTPFMDWLSWGWHIQNTGPHWLQGALNANGILAAQEIARLQQDGQGGSP